MEFKAGNKFRLKLYEGIDGWDPTFVKNNNKKNTIYTIIEESLSILRCSHDETGYNIGFTKSFLTPDIMIDMNLKERKIKIGDLV